MKAAGLAAAVLSLAVATGAQAQQKVCFPTSPLAPGGGGRACMPTEARPAASALNDGSYPAMCVGSPDAEAGCYARTNAERKEVGKLMADHDCDAAMQRALREGDYRMADTVKGLCTAGPAR
jgi:hypothetical protein